MILKVVFYCHRPFHRGPSHRPPSTVPSFPPATVDGAVLPTAHRRQCRPPNWLPSTASGRDCLSLPGTLLFLIFLTLILLRLFQQYYCYNVTGQSQESEGSYKPARIKEVHSKLHSFQASLCTLTATHLTLIYVCTYIRLSQSVPLGCLIKQAGIIIHTILNFWETPGIEPVTSESGLTSIYQTSSSTTWF